MIKDKMAYLKSANNATNKDIAEATYISEDVIKRIASGACADPSFSYIEAIAKFFDVPTDFFCENESFFVLRADEMEIARHYRKLDEDSKQSCLKAMMQRVEEAERRMSCNHYSARRRELHQELNKLSLSEIEEILEKVKNR